jgi:Fe-S cluster biogenesis protein NfuA
MFAGMETPIKITGELTPDPSQCQFHLEQPVLEDWTVSFQQAADSQGSALADFLFEVQGVVRVTVSGATITVTKNTPEPWQQFAPAIGKAIRAAFASGRPLVAATVVDALKRQPLDDLEGIIADLFEEQINPALASHGGFVRLVKVDGRDVHVEMGGGCQGCASSKATLKLGIESAIRRVAPQVRHIVDATDHAAGVNPFYK